MNAAPSAAGLGPRQGNLAVTIEIYTQNPAQSWGTTVANIFRQDLKDAGKGNGAHAYSFTVPAELKDNTERAIYGRVLGSTFVLKGSPKTLKCPPANARLSAESQEELQVTLLGNLAIGREIRKYAEHTASRSGFNSRMFWAVWCRNTRLKKPVRLNNTACRSAHRRREFCSCG